MKAVLLLLSLLAATGVHAQELDIFDVNDFVDPRDLGATAGEYGKVSCPCQPFFISMLYAGAVTDYVDLLTPTESDVAFAHLATSYYTGRWQFNLKLTQLGPFNRADPESSPYLGTPDQKIAVQVGRYFSLRGRNGRPPVVLRAEVVWSAKNYWLRDRGQTTGGSHYYDEERGFEVDTHFRLFGRALNGSIVFVEDIPARGGFTEPHRSRRLTFMHRMARRTIAGFKFDPSIAIGGYSYRGQWTSVTALPSIEITSPTIRKLDLRVHLRYQPTIQQVPLPTNTAGVYPKEWRATHQVALFIDRPVFFYPR